MEEIEPLPEMSPETVGMSWETYLVSPSYSQNFPLADPGRKHADVEA